MYTSSEIDRSNINSTPAAIDEFEDNSRVNVQKLSRFQFATDKYIIKKFVKHLCEINYNLYNYMIVTYIIYSHQSHNLVKHVGKLLGRLSEIECKVELLMETTLNNSKVINEVYTQ